ncbi:MFS transporter [Myxococcota bacterium]|nr:MFS transporter [Myxococcota bacterium]
MGDLPALSVRFVVYETWRVGALGLLAFATLIPVTLPVAVLRELVQERFAVSETLTSLFMSINMVGAAIAAPLVGALSDRIGRRRQIIIGALLLDAVCLFGLTLPVSFGGFMAIRFLEGCAHITALSILLAVASRSRGPEKRGRTMGLMGGGITLGVAMGAPLGGIVGAQDPLVPLYLGCALVTLAAALAAGILREPDSGEEEPPKLGFREMLRHNRALIAPLTFAFADRFTVGFFTTTFSLYLTRIHHLEPPQIGGLIAAFMLPFALLSYPFGRLSERFSRVAMLCGGSFLYGIGTASLAWWPPDALVGLMLALGVVSAVMFVPSLVLATELASPEIRATAMGAFNAAGSMGFIVGPAVGGFVSETVARQSGWHAGYEAAFVVAGLSEIACVLVALPFLLALVRAGKTR